MWGRKAERYTSEQPWYRDASFERGNEMELTSPKQRHIKTTMCTLPWLTACHTVAASEIQLTQSPCVVFRMRHTLINFRALFHRGPSRHNRQPSPLSSRLSTATSRALVFVTISTPFYLPYTVGQRHQSQTVSQRDRIFQQKPPRIGPYFHTYYT